MKGVGAGRPPRRGRAARRWRAVSQLGQRLLAALHPGAPEPPTHSHAQITQGDLLVSATASLLEGDAQLWLAPQRSPERRKRADRAPQPASRPWFAPQPPTPLMRLAYESGALCAEGGAPADAAAQAADAPARAAPPPPTTIAAPLRSSPETGAVVWGVLAVTRPPQTPFTPDDLDLLEAISAAAASALQVGRQVAVERRRVQQLGLVNRVSAQIANINDLDVLSERVTHAIQATFDYYYVALFTLDRGQEFLRFRAAAGSGTSGMLNPPPFAQIRLGEGMVGQAARAASRLVADDVQAEPHYRYTDALPDTRSEVALPLRFEGEIVGVLDVQSNLLADFNETDLLVLDALAHNIALAVESARLYTALQRRADQLAAVAEVSAAITSILDQDELLNAVVDRIHLRFGYPWVHLFSVHPGRRQIFYEAGSGARSERFRAVHYAIGLDDDAGIIPWVARHGETVLANEVEREPRYRPNPFPPDDTQAELTVPLVFGGEILGVLDVQSDRANVFTEDDRFLFEALADTVAVALRNASLYRSEVWRRQAAEALREVAGLLSADADLPQVLDAILTELEHILPSDLAAIWLLDEGASRDDLGAALRLAAVHGLENGELKLELAPTLTDLTTLLTPSADPLAFLGAALDADEPLIRSSPDEWDPLAALLDYEPTYSAIATPLRIGDERLGVLVLAHAAPGRYGSEARGLTAAFAGYASVAIENTRLYEAAHEQAWVSTVLLQVAEATQLFTNLPELLDTVARITPTLAGVRACMLYLLDEDRVFAPAAAAGLSGESRREFERWRFSAGEVAALDQLLQDKQPLILAEDQIEPQWRDILFPADDETTPANGRALLVVVPLVAHGEILGALLVDYSHLFAPGQPRDAQFDERLAILQGIAHQTAIAVENIRLIKAQKEEAYVSVALLQVAQAVVSSSGLEDILEGIVRITPILVGVKRALIYLWDAAADQFWLAESYGLPHGVETPPLPADRCPLLDTVRRENRLVTAPLEGEPTADNVSDWVCLPASSPPEVEEALRSAPCLLLALPLTVKGDVLGALVIEEPQPQPVESVPGSANRRLRAKRLEITTGISQQAALAIQNDRLQREMVARERLEREMQLARQIQRTFLPTELPTLPGWEVDMRWRTAREVGGDFYDFFRLPEGKFGLVIADVADKGMPAALFMTLVRTLLRATVQEVTSPAEVLARVNDVLVPDAQGGMFVTLFYALLTPETGEMTYANAGHNPPYWLQRARGTVERLVRGGMALGVQAGSLVQERTIQLEPGDLVVLYTDGVTEAFAPDGEMFGEEHLRQAILTVGAATAGEMLVTIEAALAQFTANAPPSDDLTLFALRRLPEGEA